MPFKFNPMVIPEVVLIEPQIFGDSRGFFMETWSQRDFLQGGITADFVQENHSSSKQGVLRGLHYQVEKPQGKLLRVIVGEIFDVAVDLRRGSGTFGRWVGAYLSAENKKIFWVPPGFAHGFYVVSPVAEILYSCTEFYAPQLERCIVWNDPDLGISWPLVSGSGPILSQKDREGQFLQRADFYP
ncbi:MAG: dTDP-4-dehydrorhamnose 3,5-epimerase [Magnetococcus sp. DMHC-6]